MFIARMRMGKDYNDETEDWIAFIDGGRSLALLRPHHELECGPSFQLIRHAISIWR